MCQYSSIFNRSFYKNIKFKTEFTSPSSDVRDPKKGFQSARESKMMNHKFLSGHHYCHDNVPPFRSEHGLHKVRPYIIKTLGPYGNNRCDVNAKTPSIIDHNFMNIYWLNSNLPHPRIADLLVKANWSLKKIDYFIPPWLFDRRLEHYAGTNMNNMYSILNMDNIFILNHRWMPITITPRLISEQQHIKYCSLVVRLFKLEVLRSEIDQERKNLPNNEKYKSLNTILKLVSSKIIEWQGSMIGLVLYMTASGRYRDDELHSDFSNPALKLATYDEGFHWTMHLGELHDVSSLIKLLPFFSPVEKRSQRQRRIRGQQTDAGSIGEMRGTPFDHDQYICFIMNLLNRSMLLPNKVRNVEHIITQPLKDFYGMPMVDKNNSNHPSSSSSHIPPKQPSFEKKKPQVFNKNNDIEKLCHETSKMIKNIKMICSNYTSTEQYLVENDEYLSIKRDLLINFQKMLSYRKPQIVKMWKTNHVPHDYDMLVKDIENIVDLLNQNRIISNQGIYLKSFIGVLPDKIPSIISKMDDIIKLSIEQKKIQQPDRLASYAKKILFFKPSTLQKYLSKDFKNELMKDLTQEIRLVANKKWILFNNDKKNDISSVMKRFLKCNLDNFDEIQKDKIKNIMDDDAHSEYSANIETKKGRKKQKEIYIPSWTGFAQKKVIQGEAKVLNPNGGHNSHRFLDFVMRIFSVSLLGAYPHCEFHPSFHTITEIYKFNQFNYPSIPEFCTWINTILPFDLEILKKKKNGSQKSWTNSNKTTKEICEQIDDKEGSQCRRWFIVYILREHHIYFIDEIPAISKKIRETYQWKKMCDNIIKTMDINRSMIDEVICDIKIHEKNCIELKKSNPNCKHCRRWQYTLTHFNSKLIKLYRKWPILFAIDFVCQMQRKKELTDVENMMNDQNIYFNNELLHFPSYISRSSMPYNGEKHIELLEYCPRPLMRSFEQNVIEQLSEIENIFSSPENVFERYTTEKRRRNVKNNQEIFDLSQLAVNEYKNHNKFYIEHVHDNVESIITEVVKKFHSNSRIGMEWMISLFHINLSSIQLIEKARQLFEKEQSRTLAIKVLLKILGDHPRDYFIIRTFFNIIVHYNRIKLFPTTYTIMKNTVKSIVYKINTINAQSEELPLIDHVDHNMVSYWVCLPHGTVQAAMVGTELKGEGEKNTKSYGNNNVTINPYNGKMYCTISGKRMEKRDENDVSWTCIHKPNIQINMLGRILQLYDVLFIMCESCGNIMKYSWERLCSGGTTVWCGQCIRGFKKEAKWLGYQWINETKSISPCARPIFLGGLPTFYQRCVVCINPNSIPENLNYYLMWVDTDPSGRCFYAYVPICTNHERNYHMENWEMTSLKQFTYVSQNYIRSVISHHNPIPRYSNTIAPPKEYQNPDNITRIYYHPSQRKNHFSGYNMFTIKPSVENIKQDNDDRDYLTSKKDTIESQNELLSNNIVIPSQRSVETIKRNKFKAHLEKMRKNASQKKRLTRPF